MTDPIVPAGVLLGRARVPGETLPRVVAARDGDVIDITAKTAPTSRDVCEMDDPAAYVRGATGPVLGTVDDLIANSTAETHDPAKPSLLSPIDLQAVKAAGVTYIDAPVSGGQAGAAADSWAAMNFSASSAAMQPMPAAVMAWRKILSFTSPAAKTPSISVAVESGFVIR